MRPSRLLAVLAVLSPRAANAHGAITWPPPRNAIDSNEAPWSGGVPSHVPFEFYCPFPNSTAADGARDPRNLTAQNGQACFFFNNGVFIYR